MALVLNVKSVDPVLLPPSFIPHPISLSQADSGNISNAPLTTSEQELSKKSPSDRGGEDGSGSESGSEAKGSNGNLQIAAAAAAKVGNSVQRRVEQEGQGLEEVPTAVVEEERQGSDPLEDNVYTHA